MGQHRSSQKAKENIRLYLHPPTEMQIRAFLKECGVSIVRFEEYFGIPKTVLKKHLQGERQLPPAYWHIFYKAIIPAYGSGSGFERPKRKYTKATHLGAKKPTTKPPDPSPAISEDLLANLRKKKD